MRFSGSGVPDQTQGLPLAGPGAGGEGTDGGGVDVGVGIDIKVGQPLFAWEPRSSDPPHRTSVVAVVAFGEQKFCEESVVGELDFAGCGVSDDGTHSGKPKSPAGLIDGSGRGFRQTSATQGGGTPRRWDEACSCLSFAARVIRRAHGAVVCRSPKSGESMISAYFLSEGKRVRIADLRKTAAGIRQIAAARAGRPRQ